ncbi:Ig-like domain-containing protein [Ruminococcus sp. LCP21S3_E8]
MKTKRIVSIILSVLMACSVFAGLSVAAEETATHTYSVVGSASFLGSGWDQTATTDDMTQQADGTYKRTYENVPKADSYEIKVVEDHAWDASFGGTFDEKTQDYSNLLFSVPEDNSTVDIILTITGTRTKNDKEITDGKVEVLVNGTPAEGPKQPEVETNFLVGEAGLCNGVSWVPNDATNQMTAKEDGTFEIVVSNVQPKDEAGTPYEFKVAANGTWTTSYNYDGVAVGENSNAEIVIKEPNSTVKIVLTTEKKIRAWVNDVEVTPAPTPTEPKPTETTDSKGNTSAVTSNGGIYTGPTTGEASRRYFFAMPKDWYTFNNAMACAYWWDGTDACTDWQHSYQMRSTTLTLEDGSNVYYIDIAEGVGTIIFNNGIDGGVKPAEGEEPSPNWGKNFQTANVNLEGYDANESAVYPEGVKNFGNMIYIVDPSKVDVNELSGAPTYGGEWYYLHADGKYDTTAGSTYEVKDVTAVITTKTVSIYPGKTAKINVKYSNTTDQTTKTWASSNTRVATVDQNGVVKGVKAGKATITLTVQEPGNAQALVLTKDVTVKQYVTSIKLNATKKTIYNGKSFTLKATVNPKNAANKTVTYKSSNRKIATVTSKGVVKGIKPGRVVITVTAKDGSKKVAKCTVTVKAQKATKLTISAKKTTTLKKKGASVKIKATLSPSNTYNKQIKVTSSKKGIVKLSASKINSGKTVTVKATKKGSTVVKFTAADGSRKSAQTKVTVKK